MSSLVTEVLLQAGKLDKEGLLTKVTKLSSQSNEIKTKIFQYVDSNFGDISQMFSSISGILRDIHQHQTQAKDIQNSMAGAVRSQLQDSTGEFERLTKELGETNELLYAMEKVCKLCDLYDEQRTQKGKGDMKDSAITLLSIRECLSEIRKSDLVDLKIFKLLNCEYVVVLENLIYTLEEEWISHIQWTLPKKDDVNKVILKIPCLHQAKDTSAFNDLVIAMSMLKILKPKVEKLADMIFEHILAPVIEDPNVLPEIVESGGVANVVELSLKKSSTKNPMRTPHTLFMQVFPVLECLSENVLFLRIDTDETVMKIFSARIRDAFLKRLIDKCLFATIPQNRDQLEKYKAVENAVRRFESLLVGIGFLDCTSDEDPTCKHGLVSYAMNVSVHFAARRCTDILQDARNLMKKGIQDSRLYDRSNMVREDTIFSLDENTVAVKAMPIGTDFDSQKPGKLLSDETMRFPTCRVSECAISIMDLVFKTMSEACQSSPECGIRLAATAQNIFELYQTAFPIYHKEALENIPQQSAVFHNDCMYLAHRLLTLGHQFSQISSYAKKTTQIVTFVDKVPYLRRLGAEIFLQQLKRQKQMMMQCLEPLQSFTALRNQDKFSSVEKALKQVLYQLNHLKKVWLEVLPDHILVKALGTLVNHCVAELVSTVCEMEDISSDDSVSLRLACELLLLQTPAVFLLSSTSADLTWRKHVSKWSRLEELIFILSSSMREIVDRWADGKGPLADAFTIVEVKGLIRALFQNTEHRAQAISKIRI